MTGLRAPREQSTPDAGCPGAAEGRSAQDVYPHDPSACRRPAKAPDRSSGMPPLAPQGKRRPRADIGPNAGWAPEAFPGSALPRADAGSAPAPVFEMDPRPDHGEESWVGARTGAGVCPAPDHRRRQRDRSGGAVATRLCPRGGPMSRSVSRGETRGCGRYRPPCRGVRRALRAVARRTSRTPEHGRGHRRPGPPRNVGRLGIRVNKRRPPGHARRAGRRSPTKNGSRPSRSTSMRCSTCPRPRSATWARGGRSSTRPRSIPTVPSPSLWPMPPTKGGDPRISPQGWRRCWPRKRGIRVNCVAPRPGLDGR